MHYLEIGVPIKDLPEYADGLAAIAKLSEELDSLPINPSAAQKSEMAEQIAQAQKAINDFVLFLVRNIRNTTIKLDLNKILDLNDGKSQFDEDKFNELTAKFTDKQAPVSRAISNILSLLRKKHDVQERLAELARESTSSFVTAGSRDDSESGDDDDRSVIEIDTDLANLRSRSIANIFAQRTLKQTYVENVSDFIDKIKEERNKLNALMQEYEKLIEKNPLANVPTKLIKQITRQMKELEQLSNEAQQVIEVLADSPDAKNELAKLQGEVSVNNVVKLGFNGIILFENLKLNFPAHIKLLDDPNYKPTIEELSDGALKIALEILQTYSATQFAEIVSALLNEAVKISSTHELDTSYIKSLGDRINTIQDPIVRSNLQKAGVLIFKAQIKVIEIQTVNMFDIKIYDLLKDSKDAMERVQKYLHDKENMSHEKSQQQYAALNQLRSQNNALILEINQNQFIPEVIKIKYLKQLDKQKATLENQLVIAAESFKEQGILSSKPDDNQVASLATLKLRIPAVTKSLLAAISQYEKATIFDIETDGSDDIKQIVTRLREIHQIAYQILNSPALQKIEVTAEHQLLINAFLDASKIIKKIPDDTVPATNEINRASDAKNLLRSLKQMIADPASLKTKNPKWYLSHTSVLLEKATVILSSVPLMIPTIYEENKQQYIELQACVNKMTSIMAKMNDNDLGILISEILDNLGNDPYNRQYRIFDEFCADLLKNPQMILGDNSPSLKSLAGKLLAMRSIRDQILEIGAYTPQIIQIIQEAEKNVTVKYLSRITRFANSALKLTRNFDPELAEKVLAPLGMLCHLILEQMLRDPQLNDNPLLVELSKENGLATLFEKIAKGEQVDQTQLERVVYGLQNRQSLYKLPTPYNKIFSAVLYAARAVAKLEKKKISVQAKQAAKAASTAATLTAAASTAAASTAAVSTAAASTVAASTVAASTETTSAEAESTEESPEQPKLGMREVAYEAYQGMIDRFKKLATKAVKPVDIRANAVLKNTDQAYKLEHNLQSLSLLLRDGSITAPKELAEIRGMVQRGMDALSEYRSKATASEPHDGIETGFDGLHESDPEVQELLACFAETCNKLVALEVAKHGDSFANNPLPASMALFEVDPEVGFDGTKDITKEELGIPNARKNVPAMNKIAAWFGVNNGLMFVSRDIHPAPGKKAGAWEQHGRNLKWIGKLFNSHDVHAHPHAGGHYWCPHCRAHTIGANLTEGLILSANLVMVGKGTTPEEHQFGAIYGQRSKSLGVIERLRAEGKTELVINGWATDFCVRDTIRQAMAAGFHVILTANACTAIAAELNIQPINIEAITKVILERKADPTDWTIEEWRSDMQKQPSLRGLLGNGIGKLEVIASDEPKDILEARARIHAELSKPETPEQMRERRMQLIAAHKNTPATITISDFEGRFELFKAQIESAGLQFASDENGIYIKISDPKNLRLLINGDLFDHGPDALRLWDIISNTYKHYEKIYPNIEVIKILAGNRENNKDRDFHELHLERMLAEYDRGVKADANDPALPFWNAADKFSVWLAKQIPDADKLAQLLDQARTDSESDAARDLQVYYVKWMLANTKGSGKTPVFESDFEYRRFELMLRKAIKIQGRGDVAKLSLKEIYNAQIDLMLECNGITMEMFHNIGLVTKNINGDRISMQDKKVMLMLIKAAGGVDAFNNLTPEQCQQLIKDKNLKTKYFELDQNYVLDKIATYNGQYAINDYTVVKSFKKSAGIVSAELDDVDHPAIYDAALQRCTLVDVRGSLIWFHGGINMNSYKVPEFNEDGTLKILSPNKTGNERYFRDFAVEIAAVSTPEEKRAILLEWAEALNKAFAFAVAHRKSNQDCEDFILAISIQDSNSKNIKNSKFDTMATTIATIVDADGKVLSTVTDAFKLLEDCGVNKALFGHNPFANSWRSITFKIGNVICFNGDTTFGRGSACAFINDRFGNIRKIVFNRIVAKNPVLVSGDENYTRMLLQFDADKLILARKAGIDPTQAYPDYKLLLEVASRIKGLNDTKRNESFSTDDFAKLEAFFNVPNSVDEDEVKRIIGNLNQILQKRPVNFCDIIDTRNPNAKPRQMLQFRIDPMIEAGDIELPTGVLQQFIDGGYLVDFDTKEKPKVIPPKESPINYFSTVMARVLRNKRQAKDVQSINRIISAIMTIVTTEKYPEIHQELSDKIAAILGGSTTEEMEITRQFRLLDTIRAFIMDKLHSRTQSIELAEIASGNISQENLDRDQCLNVILAQQAKLISQAAKPLYAKTAAAGTWLTASRLSFKHAKAGEANQAALHAAMALVSGLEAVTKNIKSNQEDPLIIAVMPTPDEQYALLARFVAALKSENLQARDGEFNKDQLDKTLEEIELCKGHIAPEFADALRAIIDAYKTVNELRPRIVAAQAAAYQPGLGTIATKRVRAGAASARRGLATGMAAAGSTIGAGLVAGAASLAAGASRLPVTPFTAATRDRSDAFSDEDDASLDRLSTISENDNGNVRSTASGSTATASTDESAAAPTNDKGRLARIFDAAKSTYKDLTSVRSKDELRVLQEAQQLVIDMEKLENNILIPSTELPVADISLFFAKVNPKNETDNALYFESIFTLLHSIFIRKQTNPEINARYDKISTELFNLYLLHSTNAVINACKDSLLQLAYDDLSTAKLIPERIAAIRVQWLEYIKQFYPIENNPVLIDIAQKLINGQINPKDIAAAIKSSDIDPALKQGLSNLANISVLLNNIAAKVEQIEQRRQAKVDAAQTARPQSKGFMGRYNAAVRQRAEQRTAAQKAAAIAERKAAVAQAARAAEAPESNISANTAKPKQSTPGPWQLYTRAAKGYQARKNAKNAMKAAELDDKALRAEAERTAAAETADERAAQQQEPRASIASTASGVTDASSSRVSLELGMHDPNAPAASHPSSASEITPSPAPAAQGQPRAAMAHPSTRSSAASAAAHTSIRSSAASIAGLEGQEPIARATTQLGTLHDAIQSICEKESKFAGYTVTPVESESFAVTHSIDPKEEPKEVIKVSTDGTKQKAKLDGSVEAYELFFRGLIKSGQAVELKNIRMHSSGDVNREQKAANFVEALEKVLQENPGNKILQDGLVMFSESDGKEGDLSTKDLVLATIMKQTQESANLTTKVRDKFNMTYNANAQTFTLPVVKPQGHFATFFKTQQPAVLATTFTANDLKALLKKPAYVATQHHDDDNPNHRRSRRDTP
jgi:nicotinamidase-related amidase